MSVNCISQYCDFPTNYQLFSVVFSPTEWPAQDVVPDTTSDEVSEWMKELDGFYIPSFNVTTDGTCANNTAAAADAANRGWWSCGGYTRATDIVACPDKYTWGVSFDDGPSDQSGYSIMIQPIGSSDICFIL